MGSTGGKFGAAGRAIYPASKAALLQITKNFAVELAPAGVRVLAVSPAWTWSPSVEQLAGGSRGGRRRGRAFPSARAGGIGREIAAAVCFACSDAASWMTGVDIPVDGGFSVLGPDRGFPARVVPRAGAGPGRRRGRRLSARDRPATTRSPDCAAGGGRGAERSASPALAGFSG